MCPSLALLQWRPHLPTLWCGVVLLGGTLWLLILYRRLLRRWPPRRARWLLLPKLLLLLLLLLALFDPVSAIQQTEHAKGKLLVLVDASSSMDVADDYHQARIVRARKLVEQWQGTVPRGLKLDALDFDTSIHSSAAPAGDALRGTDLGECLLALADRSDVNSYLGVVLLTDGGDEVLENPPLPKVPVSVVGIGTESANWDDVALTDVQCPLVAEKDVEFEISADILAHAGHSQGFAERVANLQVRLEHATASNRWERVADQTVPLANLRGRARLSAHSSQIGLQRYRLTVQPVPGELSALNNSRSITVNVQNRSLHALYFTRELGQEFKVLRNELGRDPGLTFTALFRTTADRFTLQGDYVPGSADLAGGLPATKAGLEAFNAVILGSFPAEELSPGQMQALAEFVEQGGTLIFLGGDQSFGRGGYAQTSLAPLFPWRLLDREPEPPHGEFVVQVPPTGLGHPILATMETVLARNSATVDSVNLVAELKPGATALLATRVGGRELAVAALQPFGKGKVLGIASNTLWKWAMRPEPLGSAYGLFWRQAIRNLTGQTEGSRNLSLRWDKDFYRPGEQALGDIRVAGTGFAAVRFTASVIARGQNLPVTVEPMPGQSQTYQVKLRFRERGDYLFRLVAYQGERVLDTCEKTFAVAPGLPEGSRLELDEPFLKQLAQNGGGSYYREGAARQFLERIRAGHTRKVTLEESSLVEAGPWFAAAFLMILIGEWILRRRINLF